MPIVEIYVWKGVDQAKKKRLMQEISKDVSEVLGAPLETVEVLINEVPMENWGKGGRPASEWGKKL